MSQIKDQVMNSQPKRRNVSKSVNKSKRRKIQDKVNSFNEGCMPILKSDKQNSGPLEESKFISKDDSNITREKELNEDSELLFLSQPERYVPSFKKKLTVKKCEMTERSNKENVAKDKISINYDLKKTNEIRTSELADDKNTHDKTVITNARDKTEIIEDEKMDDAENKTEIKKESEANVKTLEASENFNNCHEIINTYEKTKKGNTITLADNFIPQRASEETLNDDKQPNLISHVDLIKDNDDFDNVTNKTEHNKNHDDPKMALTQKNNYDICTNTVNTKALEQHILTDSTKSNRFNLELNSSVETLTPKMKYESLDNNLPPKAPSDDVQFNSLMTFAKEELQSTETNHLLRELKNFETNSSISIFKVNTVLKDNESTEIKEDENSQVPVSIKNNYNVNSDLRCTLKTTNFETNIINTDKSEIQITSDIVANFNVNDDTFAENEPVPEMERDDNNECILNKTGIAKQLPSTADDHEESKLNNVFKYDPNVFQNASDINSFQDLEPVEIKTTYQDIAKTTQVSDIYTKESFELAQEPSQKNTNKISIYDSEEVHSKCEICLPSSDASKKIVPLPDITDENDYMAIVDSQFSQFQLTFPDISDSSFIKTQEVSVQTEEMPSCVPGYTIPTGSLIAQEIISDLKCLSQTISKIHKEIETFKRENTTSIPRMQNKRLRNNNF